MYKDLPGKLQTLWLKKPVRTQQAATVVWNPARVVIVVKVSRCKVTDVFYTHFKRHSNVQILYFDEVGLIFARIYENWSAREEPFKKPLTCRRKAELATLRGRHFASPGLKKLTWEAPAWIYSLFEAHSRRRISIVLPNLASHGTYTLNELIYPGRTMCYVCSVGTSAECVALPASVSYRAARLHG